jgi:hypothetical protein
MDLIAWARRQDAIGEMIVLRQEDAFRFVAAIGTIHNSPFKTGPELAEALRVMADDRGVAVIIPYMELVCWFYSMAGDTQVLISNDAAYLKRFFVEQNSEGQYDAALAALDMILKGRAPHLN